MINLKPPERTLETLKALAASGSSHFARKAQAEVRQRVHACLRGEVRG